jgi:hypothetical protein
MHGRSAVNTVGYEWQLLKSWMRFATGCSG